MQVIESAAAGALVFACTFGVVVSGQDRFSPARYKSGALPALPAMVVGGGDVILEVTVSPKGRVTAIVPLRITAPFTDFVTGAVRTWQFVPAEEPGAPTNPGAPPSRTPVDTKVLVAAVFRPPALTGPTLGDPPRDVAAPSGESAFPLEMPLPPFPPLAVGSGVVLLEARVDSVGRVAEATVIRSAPPFDAAALAVLKAWRFRPAQVQGTPVSTLVYILFGFPAPVTSRVP